jgi:beta-1,4-N-acetylglucosaminyltransferase
MAFGARLRTTPADFSVDPVDVLLVCTPGGHLFQLASLKGAWDGYARAWVTGESSDTRSLLRDERVYWGHGPAARSLRNLFRNLRLAHHVIGELKPKVIVSTGAAMCVPFVWVGRLRGVKVFYVETVTRIDAPSLTCRLVRLAADRVYVQWPELTARVPGSRYAGSVFTGL